MSDDEDIDGIPIDPSNPLFASQPFHHEDGQIITPGIKIPRGLDAEALAPSSLQAVPEQVIKSLQGVAQKKSPFQKHKELQEAKKKQAEDDAKKIYEEFVEAFKGGNQGPNISFVKGETIFKVSPSPSTSNTNTTSSSSENNSVSITPSTTLSSSSNSSVKTEDKTNSSTSASSSQKSKLTNIFEEEETNFNNSKKTENKSRKKTAMDELKEELKIGQVTRDKATPSFSIRTPAPSFSIGGAKHSSSRNNNTSSSKYSERDSDYHNSNNSNSSSSSNHSNTSSARSSSLSSSDKATYSGISFIDESGDPDSCNLLVANIATQVSEQTLWKTFGKYGPIEQLQIILPVSSKSGDLHKFNYALVKFTERSISEVAKSSMDGYTYFGHPLKIIWAKPGVPDNNSTSSTSSASSSKSKSSSSSSLPSEKEITIKIPSKITIKEEDVVTTKSHKPLIPISINPISINPISINPINPPSDSTNTSAPSSSSTHLIANEIKTITTPISSNNNSNSSNSSNSSVSSVRSSKPLEVKEKPSSSSNSDSSTTPITIAVPIDHEQLFVINTLAQFVAKDGLKFEKMIFSREENNPRFQFLRNTESVEYKYYRWKIYSLLQPGDLVDKWRTLPFQIVNNGPIYNPPNQSFFSTMPKIHEREVLKKLNREQKETFEWMLRDLVSLDGNSATASAKGNAIAITTTSVSRARIRDAMCFALEHADLAFEITQVIVNSIVKETNSTSSYSESSIDPNEIVTPKLAKLYLISDILYNSQARVQHASSYRRVFERKLPIVFESMQQLFETVRKSTGRITAGNFKDQVLKLLRIWQSWSIYSDSFISSLNSTFLGTLNNPPSQNQTSVASDDDEDIDGVPIEINK